MTDPLRVGFVILGCGYMGGNGILAFTNLVNYYRQHDSAIELELVLVTEPKLDTFSLVSEYCVEHLESSPRRFREFQFAFPYLLRELRRGDFPIIIYDATPPFYHFSHLAIIHDTNEKNLIYLGEKPFFTDPNEIVGAKQFNEDFSFFCELIEAANPIFQDVHEYLTKEQPQIESMSFWRAGSSGIKTIIGTERPGVQGGALLDKSPHDFSISINILGPEGVSGTVEDATIHHLIPTLKSLYSRSGKEFFDATSTPTSRLVNDLQYRQKLPADGLSSVSVKWFSPTWGDIPEANYLFSWLGLTGHPKEQKLIDELSGLGHPVDSYVISREEPGPNVPAHPLTPEGNRTLATNPTHQGTIEEVRIGIIRCSDRTIVCNFLEKEGGGIDRFASVHPNNGDSYRIDRQRHSIGRELKGQELATIFQAVVNYCVNKKTAPFVGRHVTLETHDVLLGAQDIAIRKLEEGTLGDLLKKSIEIVKTKVKKL